MSNISTEGSEDLVINGTEDSGFKIQSSGSYKEIDFDKVKTLQDVIDILEALNIQIWDGNNEFEKIQHLLKD